MTKKELLNCKLTEEETLKYSRELARATQEKLATEDEKKEVVSEYTAKITKKTAEIGVLATKISTGHEMREVPVEWSYDWVEGVKTCIRQDTFDIVKVLDIETWEKQEHLPGMDETLTEGSLT